MHESTTADSHSEPSVQLQPQFQPTPPGKSIQKMPSRLVILAAGVLLAIIASVALLYTLHHRQATSNVSSKQPLVLYYRDGKTVLWDSAKDQASDTETSGFVAQVKADLAEAYGGPAALKKGDWRVTTTLDATLQKKAKQQVTANQAAYDQRAITNGALIAEDVTNGQIVSWIGGFKDFDTTPDTVAQPTVVGALALPLTYASLIENTTNYGAGSVFTDQQGPLEGYPCTNTALPAQGGNCLYNYDRQYAGQVTLRQALGAARLVPAAQAGQTVGTTKLVSEFDKLLPNPSSGHFACYLAGSVDFSREHEVQCYLAASHGDGLFARPQDMIQAYATLANGGKSLRQVSFTSAMVDGKARPVIHPDHVIQAVRPDAAYIISDILSDPTNSYLPASYDHIFTANGTKVSVQPGINSDATVGSMVEYTNKYAVGFWGFTQDANHPIKGPAETVTQPTVTGWLSAAHAGRPYPNQTKPSDIKELPAPVSTLHLLVGTTGPSPAVDIYPSWYK